MTRKKKETEAPMISETLYVPSFPVNISLSEARIQAQAKGCLWGRLLLRNKLLWDIRLHAVEYHVLMFEVTHYPNWLARTFFADRDPKKQICRVIVNGTTGGCCWAEELPVQREILTLPVSAVQTSCFAVDELAARGKKLVWRVLRRRIGGLPELRLKEAVSVYRPFYVAFYDEPVTGTRIHYLPIAADGCSTHRAF